MEWRIRRTPYAEGQEGRDHNTKAFTLWMAGGGIRHGFAYGRSDEYGYEAVENPVQIADLHATILHSLGLDHEQLTYRHAGRDFRLTDTRGRVVTEVFCVKRFEQCLTEFRPTLQVVPNSHKAPSSIIRRG